ncbi:uncharacterized protein LOC133889723 [Phragmites australis]|uniref:uncharacterized protein LOC133889723 n=1 Tax=Phragmites australis TaxID=29695 RepID=UPI002D7915EC|nr:uncharacterized protein LOC133889723 [Phragmites australis]
MASNGADAPGAETALTGAARQCICSPTTHPGSFRCRLHRGGGGMQRPASCQQFGPPGAPGSRSLCSVHLRRAASKQRLAHHTTVGGGGGMSRSASEQQFLPSAGVPRLASWQDLAQKK